MRPDQTDPRMNPMTPRPVDDSAPLRPRERAGSPGPMELDDTAASWQAIKSRFVDDPAGATAAAEGLVRRAVEQRIHALENEAAALCAPSRDDESSSTEDMRTRLIRYQEFCNRLAG